MDLGRIHLKTPFGTELYPIWTSLLEVFSYRTGYERQAVDARRDVDVFTKRV